MQQQRQRYVASLLGLFFMNTLSHGSRFPFYRDALQEDERIEEQNSIEQPSSPLKNYEKEWVRIRNNLDSILEVSTGQRVTLTCEADGNPPPKIYWLTGEEARRQIDSLERKSLADKTTSSVSWEGIARIVSKKVIDCVKASDQGLITYCVAVSGDRINVSNPTILSVKGRDVDRESCEAETSPPTITLHYSMRLALIGSTVVLPCVASGRPRPFTIWYDSEGNSIVPSRANSRYRVLSNGDLVIVSVQWNDMNGYTCVAKSTNGQDRVETFLYPLKNDSSQH